MPNPRSKRKNLREERKRKREAEEADETPKRQRRADDGPDLEQEQPAGENEFFGMLSEEEQEYFRGAGEVLDLNEFKTPDELETFVQNVFKEAEGKELKLACSQSCSRLMEKLVKLSSPEEKKRLFEAFAGHFLTLVQHRFASHCCEMLFLAAAPIVSEEMKTTGFKIDLRGADEREANKAEQSMEQLYLLTLDELEAELSFLLTQTFASHSLRVLLLVLSGKPIDYATMHHMLKSKSKKGVSVPGSNQLDEILQQQRDVPASFDMAIKKIILDSVATLDNSSLRVLVSHPTGNPILQLLLELDLKYGRNTPGGEKADEGGSDYEPVLLPRLLPDVPKSLKEDTSMASEFVTTGVYDQIGSRLLETLIEHCSGKIFKALYQNIFVDKMASYVRNEIAAYPAIKVLARLGKGDLTDCIQKIIPAIPTLMEKERYNVIKTLFERCRHRNCDAEIGQLRVAVVDACGGDPKDLVPKVCHLRDKEARDLRTPQYALKQKDAVLNHGAQLVTTMLETPGPAAKAAQTSILALGPDDVLFLATKSAFTAKMFTTALEKPSLNPVFHKSFVATILHHVTELASNNFGNQVVKTIIEIPSRDTSRSIPFHMKETLMNKLTADATLQNSPSGRYVWRQLKGVIWKTRRLEWIKWAKEIGGDDGKVGYAAVPISREEKGQQGRGWYEKKKDVNPAKNFAARRIKDKERKQAREAVGEDMEVDGADDTAGNSTTLHVEDSHYQEMVDAPVFPAGSDGGHLEADATVEDKDTRKKNKKDKKEKKEKKHKKEKKEKEAEV